ncbi:phage tail assembly protein [Kaustia mangrovi]|uniref:Phage tail assembly protein n=1 Tax=Kaustia mangrovi TaxID=2593653 RepID=A0A7S8HCR5_9HYPH|nr:phage tail assembly protein [Kaustia mangrovi]QPC44007.1 phage tail assembly protein [Kaustia mangrovi]
MSKKKTQTVTLKEPVDWGDGETITHLEFRVPKAKDFRNLPMEPKFGDILDLMGKLCTRADGPLIVEELEPADMMAVAGVVGDFIPGGPGIGKTA